MVRMLVEDGLKFDVHRAVRAGRERGAPFRWQWTDSDGNAVGYIVVAVDLDGAGSGTPALSYRCNRVPFDQRFRLHANPCPFGGFRWFAICPATGQRAAQLYLLNGEGFHARARYGRVSYRTQRAASAIDRVRMRRDRILLQHLKADDPDFVPKPKWMRWKTYNTLMARLADAEGQLDAHMRILLRRCDGF
jgi:hypothetical protein